MTHGIELEHPPVFNSPLLHKQLNFELSELFEQHQQDLQLARAQGRKLKMAVVGQMKAGKSSFLNAAFFADDLLPKAATPMTAALTRIGYANPPYAEVEFYTEADWQVILHKADEYTRRYAEVEAELQQQQPKPSGLSSLIARPARPAAPITPAQINEKVGEELRAYHQLVQSAQRSGLPLAQYFGQTIRLTATTAAELARQLPEYVGSSGRFTAITKMTSLYVNDQRLQDIEIYDTPGFNDPVVSRGLQTRKFLGQSDVVFLLSFASQFLTKSDLALLREQLAQAGIDHQSIVLVATQRDLSLRQDAAIAQQARQLALKQPEAQRAQATVGYMLQLLDLKLRDMAFNTLDQHLADPKLDDGSKRVLTALRERDPLSISSWCSRMAEQGDALSADNQEQLNSLRSACNYPFSAADLQQISNIARVRQVLLQHKDRKDELLASKEQHLQQDFARHVGLVLNACLHQLQNRASQIGRSDLKSLQRLEQRLSHQLQQGEAALMAVFNQHSLQVHTSLSRLYSEFSGQLNDYQVESQTQVTTQTKKVASSGFWAGLLRLFDAGGFDYVNTEVVTHYAKTQDAIAQIEQFANDADHELRQQIHRLVNPELLHQELCSAALELFDLSDDSLDPDFISSQLRAALGHIVTPKLDWNQKNYDQQLVARFGFKRAEGKDNIRALQNQHREAMLQILEDLQQAILNSQKQIEQHFSHARTHLQTHLLSMVQDSLRSIAEDLNNKEAVLQQLREAIAELQPLQQRLSGIQ